MLLRGTKDFDVDILGRKLQNLGRMAANMPPSWEGAKDWVPVCTQEGGNIGRVLPGVGLVCDVDLKEVGITKRVPKVFDRSLALKLLDWFKGERAAIAAATALCALFAGHHAPGILFGLTSFSDIKKAVQAGNRQRWVASMGSNVGHVSTVNPWYSMRSGIGSTALTAVPSGAAMDNTMSSSFAFGLAPPISGKKKYLISLGLFGSPAVYTGHCVMLADLLVAADGISMNSTATTTVNTTALTRYTSGSGVMLTFEITTAPGTSASPNVTVSYTNQAGASGRSVTFSIPSSLNWFAFELAPATLGPYMPLQSGDYGVKSVQSVAFSAVMGGGVMAAELYKPLMFVEGVSISQCMEKDFYSFLEGPIQLVTDSNGNLGFLNVYSEVLSGAIPGLLLDAIDA